MTPAPNGRNGQTTGRDPAREEGDEVKAKQRNSNFVDWRGKRLVQEDWDFRKCPPDELRHCLCWEADREIALACDHPRKDFWKQREIPYLLAAKKLHHKDPDVLDDPDLKPFGVMGGKSGRTSRRFDKFLRAAVGTNGICPWSIFADWEHWLKHDDGICYSGQQGYGHFVIDFERSNSEIVASFQKWLSHHKTPDRKILQNKGRTAPDEYLKMLGARRLLIAYGYKRAKAESERVLGRELYANERSWWNAKKTMEKRLADYPPSNAEVDWVWR